MDARNRKTAHWHVGKSLRGSAGKGVAGPPERLRIAVERIAAIETAGRILPAMVSSTHQGFRTAPIPSGWVQTGERWDLWWNGRSVANITPAPGRGVRLHLDARKIFETGFLLGGGQTGAQQLLEPHLWDEMHGFGLGGDYGLGVMRSERLYGSTPVRLLHHRGGGFGFGCVFTYCRQANAGFAAMFNRATSAGYGIGERLLDQLLSARFGPRQPRVPLSSLAPIRLNQDQMQRMAGDWIGRSGKAKIVVAGSGELQLHRGAQAVGRRFAAIDDDQLFTADTDGEVATYRYHAATERLPAHLECTNGEDGLDQNDPIDGATGPQASHWRPWLGRYRIDQWGKPAMSVVLEQRQGWLYIDGIRLVTEVEPGLLFTSDGEAVDFRSSQPTWRNLRLQRVQPVGRG